MMDEHELRKYLTAFADGELDVEQNLKVLEYVSMNPQAARRVMHQQQLRRLVDRAMRGQTPAAPQQLRAKVEAILDAVAVVESAPHAEAGLRLTEEPGPDASAPPAPIPLRLWPWAAAAVVALAAGLMFWMNRQAGLPSPGPAAPLAISQFAALRPDLLEPRRVAGMVRRHGDCAREIQLLVEADAFGREVMLLNEQVVNVLQNAGDMPALDLTALGYRYDGAGKCTAPGGKAVHLVYQPISGDGQAISLWVRADPEGKVKIEPRKLYAATPDGAADSILIWRNGGTVFYLVGEATRRVVDTALAMRDAPVR